MRKEIILFLLIAVTMFQTSYPQKFETLADTPAMGWNSWNKFGCEITEEIVRGVADAMVETGLRDAVKNSLQFWFKPLTGGDWAFCILNRSRTDKEYTIDWQDFNFTDTLSVRSTSFDSQVYNIRNLWENQFARSYQGLIFNA